MSNGAAYALGAGLFAVAVAGLLSGAAQVQEGNTTRALRDEVKALRADVRMCEAEKAHMRTYTDAR